MAKLENIQVSFISLVDKPANKKDIVYKCRNQFNGEKLLKVSKVNDEGLVAGTVYEPNVKDADGDWADKETIKKAAHDFMLNGRNFNVDENHNEVPAGAAVVESYLDEIGAWKVVIKMDPNSETFQKVKKGEYKGLSMMAQVKKKEEEPPVTNSGKELEELKAKIEKQEKTIEDLLTVVKGMPKSRQLVIDKDGSVTIAKQEDKDDEVLSEFDFAKLN